MKSQSTKKMQQEILHTLIVLIAITISLITVTSIAVTVQNESRRLDENLKNTALLTAKSQAVRKAVSGNDAGADMDALKADLSNIDVVSVVGADGIRKYHSNSSLIGTRYDGTMPEFDEIGSKLYAVNDTGPSGSQRRAYAAIYAEDGSYRGFIIAVMLRRSIYRIIFNTIIFHIICMAVVIACAVPLSRRLSGRIKRLMEDLSGVKHIVESMRANNHDFINKLHVILGLIQIGRTEEACEYITGISSVQQKVFHNIMKNIEDPSVAALLIGKHARAAELDIRFSLKPGSCMSQNDISLPSGDLVTIIGNLIENAMDSMDEKDDPPKELSVGIFTRENAMIISVEDTGMGMSREQQEEIFKNGFSTKGENRGTGLYIVGRLVKKYRGTISVESEPGMGTAFTVTLER